MPVSLIATLANPLSLFIPEMIDVDVNDVGQGIEVVIPYTLGDHGARQNLSFIAHQIFQQGVFFGGKVNPFFSSEDLAGLEVHGQIRHLKRRSSFRLTPSEDGSHPSQQFIDGKGFDHIVIGTDVQPLHNIPFCVFCRQEDDWRVNTLCPDGLEDFDTIHLR
jgi:hypothetical protein